MTDTATLTQISPHVVADAPRYAGRFAQRDPFRHVVIENFFAPDYAARLLAEFPAFERGNARNENGEIGNKSTIEKIRGLGPAYATLDDLVRSPALLDLVGRVTGIPHLLYDPWYFGGGTHENRDGQDLDPHVDFNRHPLENWHRRAQSHRLLQRGMGRRVGRLARAAFDPRSPDDRARS